MLNNLSHEELSACFHSVRQEISGLRSEMGKQERETYLTRQEVSEMLKCDLSTVHNWTKAGILKAYGIGNRVYYKLSEIESSMIPLNRNRKN